MPLTQDEEKEFNRLGRKTVIDILQGMNYAEDSKYREGIDNFRDAIDSLVKMLEKIKS